MNSIEQEALSRKYSNKAFIILPLEKGQFAVFSKNYELMEIMIPNRRENELYTMFKKFAADSATRCAAAQPKRPSLAALDATLDLDLDLDL